MKKIKDKTSNTKKFNAKKVYNIFFKIAVSVLVCVTLAVVPTLCISLSTVEDKLSRASGYKGVLELWNIDTFEGGTASKTAYLSSMAVDFSNQNKGLYVMVKNITLTECMLALESGKTPAMISYGIGTGEKILSYLAQTNINTSILPQFLNAGKVSENIYGYAWCSGLYMLVSTTERLTKAGQAENSNLGEIASLCGSVKTLKNGKTQTTYSVAFGGGGYCNPVQAFNQNYNKLVSSPTSYNPDWANKTAYNAYCDFIEGKANILLGTQRDLARIENRYSQGKIDGVVYNFLGGYTDMTQFISPTSGLSSDTLSACEAFIKFILSQPCQQKLSKIGMLSTTGLNLYTEGQWANAQNAFNSISMVQNAFTSSQQIALNKEQSLVL